MNGTLLEFPQSEAERPIIHERFGGIPRLSEAHDILDEILRRAAGDEEIERDLRTWLTCGQILAGMHDDD